ncbi:MAG: response regulator [Gemmatimonadaceae bacterium]|nr:response regulator [Gemmatimonadaceae bacterium]
MSDTQKNSILIVEDEQSIRDGLVELFDQPANAITAAPMLPEALAALRAQTFELIVTDLRLGGKRDGGLQVMGLAGMLSPDALVLVLTAFPDDDNKHASFRLGALHFLEKPIDLATIAALAAEHGIATALRPDVQPLPKGAKTKADADGPAKS